MESGQCILQRFIEGPATFVEGAEDRAKHNDTLTRATQLN